MEKYIEANKKRWDQLTLEHEDSAFYDLEGFKKGKDRLRSIELSELGDVEGKSLLHLQCHFGMDTLAWARRGASVTGIDFSEKAIALAQSLSEELDIPELQVEELPVDSTCTYTALVNLFCRFGPGQVYPEVDSFVPDDVADVIGISPDSSRLAIAIRQAVTARFAHHLENISRCIP